MRRPGALNLPNSLCILRMVVAPIIAWTIVDGHLIAALGLFAAAALTDALDGFIARRFRQRTALGALLDPLADKVLMIAAFGAAAWAGLVPWWLAGLLLVRDMVLLAGSLTARMRHLRRNLAPSGWGKLSTVLQVALLCWLLAARLWPAHIGRAPVWVIAGVAAVIALAGLVYALRWRRNALQSRQAGACLELNQSP